MSNIPYKLHPLIHAAEMVQDRLAERLAVIGIKPRQARILNVLNRMGTASQAELAREFAVTRASMSTMTARLTAAGFVVLEINSAEPHRSKLRLTAKGAKLIAPINEAWREVDRLMEATIGAEQADELAHLAGTLRTRLGGTVAGARTGYRYYGENAEPETESRPNKKAQ